MSFHSLLEKMSLESMYNFWSDISSGKLSIDGSTKLFPVRKIVELRGKPT